MDSKTSLLLVRGTAFNKGVMLAPTDVRTPTALSGPVRLSRLEIPGLLSYLRVPEDRLLGIVVPHKTARVRAKHIQCTVDGSSRGDMPYLQLCSADPNVPSPLVPNETRVFVQSAANIVLGMAKQLRCKVIAGKLSHRQAVLMLTKLCLELCDTYTHDPFEPHTGAVMYGVPQRLTCKELNAFLSERGSEQGLSLAREVLPYVYDLSGSPQESFMGPALFGPSYLGGLELCEFAANKPLELNARERASINYRTITPDFQLLGYRSVVEYLGEIHNEGDNPRIDHRRSLDYQTLGVREFSFWYEDVSTINSFMISAVRIVSVLEQFDGPKARRRFCRLTNDPAFRERQRVLFAVFRPWLRGLPGSLPA